MSYYNEEIEKNTKYRQDYENGIALFLEESKEKAEKKRKEFIAPEKYAKNPETYRKHFIRLLGFPLTEKRETPVLLEKIFVAKDKNVNIYRLQFAFFGNVKFYGIYFEQIENPQEKPFVIGLHGGSGTPELVSSIHQDSANYNHLVRRMTDRGANVFVPQLLLWQKDVYGGEYDRTNLDGKLRQLGGSITALELYMIQGCIDYFIQKEKINTKRIGVAGMSYGGMYASHLAAIDTRIKVCYSCSWVEDVFIHSWPDWSYLNAQYTFTAAETLGLIAPRALVVGMGNADELFDWKITEKTCERIQEYYSTFEKSDSFKCVIFEGNHELDKGDEELEFLFDNL